MPLTTYTAGEVLTAASLNDNFAFAAQGGLTLISTTTIGTAVSSVTVSDAFSATYDGYKITVTGGAGSADLGLNLTFGATTANYYWADNAATWLGVSVINGSGGSPGSAALLGAGKGTTSALSMSLDVFRPFATDRTWVNGLTVWLGTALRGSAYSGYLDNTTSYTAFTLTTSTGTITGGEIRVYGYVNS
jgi:hypothetical protein